MTHNSKTTLQQPPLFSQFYTIRDIFHNPGMQGSGVFLFDSLVVQLLILRKFAGHMISPEKGNLATPTKLERHTSLEVSSSFKFPY